LLSLEIFGPLEYMNDKIVKKVHGLTTRKKERSHTEGKSLNNP
jgi:hypothetical protein